jgi:hypothetical protein
MAQEKVRLLAMLSVAESRPNANKEAPDRRRVRGARVVDVNLGNHPDSTLDRARSKRFRRPPGPGFN